MKTGDFLFAEIIKVIDQEIGSYTPKDMRKGMDAEVKTLYDSLDGFEGDIDNIELKVNDAFAKEPLIRLKYAKSIIDTLSLFKKYYRNNDLKVLNKLISITEEKTANAPKDKIHPLLWVFAMKEKFTLSEYFEKDIRKYLQEVFEKYSYLLDLEDFFNEWDIFEINTHHKFWASNKMTKIFENAIRNNPNNTDLLFWLTTVYSVRNESPKTLSHAYTYLENLSENHKAFIYSNDENPLLEKHINLLQHIAYFYYMSKDYDKAMEYANMAIDNLPIHIHRRFDDDIQDETIPDKEYDIAIDALLIRVNINLIRKNTSALKRDYKILNNDWLVIDYPIYKSNSYFRAALDYISDNNYDKKMKDLDEHQRIFREKFGK